MIYIIYSACSGIYTIPPNMITFRPSYYYLLLKFKFNNYSPATNKKNKIYSLKVTTSEGWSKLRLCPRLLNANHLFLKKKKIVFVKAQKTKKDWLN